MQIKMRKSLRMSEIIRNFAAQNRIGGKDMFSRLYGILLPFFVSFLLAWLLDPLVSFIQHKCRVKFRVLSVAITLVLFVGLLTLGIYLLIPAVEREVKTSAVGVEEY